VAIIKINDNPSTRELRQFAGIWFPLFWVIIGSFIYAAGARSGALAAIGAGAIAGAIGVARPRFIHPIYLLWMYAAYPIGFVVSHLLLGAIFYLLVTPVGLLMKLIGYDALRRRLRTGEPSYWVRTDMATDKKQYFRQF
jgi:hypothetical protein